MKALILHNDEIPYKEIFESRYKKQLLDIIRIKKTLKRMGLRCYDISEFNIGYNKKNEIVLFDYGCIKSLLT